MFRLYVLLTLILRHEMKASEVQKIDQMERFLLRAEGWLVIRGEKKTLKRLLLRRGRRVGISLGRASGTPAPAPVHDPVEAVLLLLRQRGVATRQTGQESSIPVRQRRAIQAHADLNCVAPVLRFPPPGGPGSRSRGRSCCGSGVRSCCGFGGGRWFGCDYIFPGLVRAP